MLVMRAKGPFAFVELVPSSRKRIAELFVLQAIYRAFPTFAPGLFHIFFHSCGKLRGETLRTPFGRRRGPDCSTGAFGAAIDTSAEGSLLFVFLRLARIAAEVPAKS